MTMQPPFKISFGSPYYFGDLIEFESVNGAGQGRIIDITISDNGAVSYSVQLDDGSALCGIYLDEVRSVLQREDSLIEPK